MFFYLLSQPESGVATPPKKTWPPIGGDRRVSLESLFGSFKKLAWLAAACGPNVICKVYFRFKKRKSEDV